MKYSNFSLFFLFLLNKDTCSAENKDNQSLVQKKQQQQVPLFTQDLRGLDTTLANDAVIDNGTIKLGINGAGNLIIPREGIGLQYYDGSSWWEVLNHGILAEGFGVSASKKSDGTSFYGSASKVTQRNNLVPADVDYTTTTAHTLTNVKDTDGTYPMTIEHDFQPSSDTNYLYEITVTIKNKSLTDTLTDIRYRRVMDWDVPPDVYNECVSIFYDSSSTPKSLEYATDNGFVELDPRMDQSLSGEFSCPDTISCPAGGVLSEGPDDNGAMFNFLFKKGGLNREIAPLDEFSFKMYYGAAPDKSTADAAVNAAGVQVVSYGFNKGNSVAGGSGSCEESDGSDPGVFIFGFSEIEKFEFTCQNIGDQFCSREDPTQTKFYACSYADNSLNLRLNTKHVAAGTVCCEHPFVTTRITQTFSCPR